MSEVEPKAFKDRDLAYAEGYNDGFRHGKQLRPTPVIEQTAEAIASGLDRPDAVEWIGKVIKQYHSRQLIEEQKPSSHTHY